MLEIQLNMYHAVAVAAVLYALGNLLITRIPVLGKYCIPAPLVGGLCFAMVNTACYAAGIAYITFDATLQSVFMTMFFTTVGFTVSLPLLAKGGKAVAICLALASALTILQNILGAGVLGALGEDPRLGLAVGSIALIGGPGTAAAFGPDLEAAGAVGGNVVGLAAATFGLVMGSVMGGPVARLRIVKHNLKCTAHVGSVSAPAGSGEAVSTEEGSFRTDSGRFVKGFMLIMFCLGVGSWLSAQLKILTGMTFPGYIGAMLVAVAVRNVMDGAKSEYPENEIETVGNMSLSLFLAMAMMGLKLWELGDLALPMMITLALQILLMFLFSYFIVFNFMGRDYDAAVMVTGFIGFAMGATSNAMANMQAVTRKYGPSPTAYFAIPMVGGMFIDFVNAVVITSMISWLS